jgi:hypothetical protein
MVKLTWNKLARTPSHDALHAVHTSPTAAQHSPAELVFEHICKLVCWAGPLPALQLHHHQWASSSLFLLEMPAAMAHLLTAAAFSVLCCHERMKRDRLARLSLLQQQYNVLIDCCSAAVLMLKCLLCCRLVCWAGELLALQQQPHQWASSSSYRRRLQCSAAWLSSGHNTETSVTLLGCPTQVQ